MGPKLDGSLGLRGPRTQWLWVLYEMTLSKVVDEGKVVSMEMCGWKPEAGELGPQALTLTLTLTLTPPPNPNPNP